MFGLIKDIVYLTRIRLKGACAKIRYEAQFIRHLEANPIVLDTSPRDKAAAAAKDSRLDRLVGKIVIEVPNASRFPVQLELPFPK